MSDITKETGNISRNVAFAIQYVADALRLIDQIVDGPLGFRFGRYTRSIHQDKWVEDK